MKILIKPNEYDLIKQFRGYFSFYVLSIIFSPMLLVSNTLHAQQLPCYFDEHLEYLFQLDPIYREAILMNEDDLQEMMEENPLAIMNSQIYTIPVVFHIIHKDEALGSETNISSTLIDQALIDLNDYFRDAQNLGNDVEIEFCLAVRNPEGGSTSGINRVNGLGVNLYSTSGLTIGENEEDVKSLSRWPNIDYLNIWIVSEITDHPIETDVLGTLPGTDPSIDGVVLAHYAAGNSNYSSAIVHGAGHFLDLYHTFHGGTASICPFTFDCSQTGDKCCDTDPHKRITSGCDENATNDCTTNPLGDLVHNNMSFFPYNCHYLFTGKQIMRMRAALMSQRSGLIESLGCTSPCNTTSTDFTPSALEVVVGQSLYFTNTTTPSNSTYIWSVEGFNFTTPDLNYQFNVPGRILVSLRSTYQGCTNEHREYIDVILPETCSYIYPDCELLYNGTFAENHLTIGTQHHFVPSLQVNHENKVCNWINKRETPFFCSRIDEDIFGLRTDSEELQESIVTQEEIPFEDGKYYKVTFEYLIGNSLSYQSDAPDPKFVIGLSHSNDFGNLNDDEILKEFSGLWYDFYDSGGDCIDISPNFNYYEITFKYTSNMGKYLFFQNCFTAMPDHNQVSNIYLRDIHIPLCEDCISVPEFIYNIEDCSVSFEGTNLGDEALSFQWDFGDGFGSTSQNSTHEYLFPGTFEVCLSIPCSSELSATECQEIEITGPCTNCTELSGATATACNVDELNLNTYLASFSVEVPNGYKICDDANLFIYSDDVLITVTSYSIIDASLQNDLLMVGVKITGPLGYNFIQNGAQGFFILCNEEDEKFCFTIDFSGDECANCLEIETPSQATCNESLSDQNTYVYDGVIEIEFDQSGYIFDGFESSELGFEILSATPSGNFWTIQYRITVENLYFASTNIIFRFHFEDIKWCVSSQIIITEPCAQLPTDCVEEWDEKTLDCSQERVDYFEFPFEMIVPNNGYSICEGGLFGTITGGGIVEILYAQIQGPNLDFSLNILMPSNYNDQNTYYLRLYLCNNRGEMVCYLFPFILECNLISIHNPIRSGISLTSFETDSFSLYPNPAESSITIQYPGFDASSSVELELINLTGQILQSEQLSSRISLMELTKLVGGVYFVRLKKNGSLVSTERFVLMH